ncbi:MAG: ATP-binding cassette domain-containing protein [Acidobacteriota bacterium]|nr:ATP-binding cassette domain-containing protein [Acidobacteriota bacterium]
MSKSFGETLAVDDVSLRAGAGEIVGLVGENGAGKTTLMRIIAGEIAPDRGTVTLEGTVGFVHQHFLLVSEFTIAENLALAVGRKGTVDFDRPERLVRDLSVGEKAKVELMKAIARKPDILILDEPTSVLTPGETAELFDVIRGLANAGTAILLISHKIAEVLSVATRTVVMRRGRIVADGSGMSADRLANAMIGGAPAILPAKHKTAAGLPALDYKNLTVAGGEIVAIIGVAGNGQTELATTLRDTLPRRTTAFIPEDRTRDGLIAEMTIAENLALGTKTPAKTLIEQFDIRAESPQQRAGSLSGGNQQKVLLARELDRNLQVIVAAEPTRGLDIEATRFVHEQLQLSADRGAAILMITSDLDEAFALADAVHVIFRGRLSERLSPSDAAANAGRLMAGLP